MVGIAGGQQGIAYLTDTLGLDAAIDYKAGPVAELLEAVVPSGVDIYFDNVGGETLDAALMQISRKARIIVCGGISQYGDMTTATGPANYLQLISKSATMTGFTMLDYMHRIPEALTDLSAWVEEGSLRHRQHILEGIDHSRKASECCSEARTTESCSSSCRHPARPHGWISPCQQARRQGRMDPAAGNCRWHAGIERLQLGEQVAGGGVDSRWAGFRPRSSASNCRSNC